MDNSKRSNYAYREKNHLCVTCGKPLDADWYFVNCQDCKNKAINYYHEKMNDDTWHENRKEKHRLNQSKNYKEKKENGMCVRCGKRKPLTGFAQCPICIEYNYAHNNWKPTQEQRKQYNDREKDLRQYRIQNKLCTECGKALTDTNFKTCLECRIKARRKQERYRSSKKVLGMECGTCIRCGKPRKDGYMLCEEHYNQAVEQCLKNVITRLENKMKEGNL